MKGSDLKIKNLSKSFGDTQVLKNISFRVKKGELFSILGPSGCGKTTLLRIIGGFEDPDEGRILMDNQDILELAPNKRGVNTIFQNYALFPHLSVYENIAFPLRIKKYTDGEIKEEVERYLVLARLQDHIRKYPSQLSGGQKQRVAIARALVNQPNILLLDEPLSALDAKLRQHMLIELDSIHDDVGITFIYVTHDQQEAMSVSDYMAVMNKGEILQVGTPSEIYEKPVNAFVADFIGETNFIEGKVTEVGETTGRISVEGLGVLTVDKDCPINVGDRVKLTIRPEKIRITKKEPVFATNPEQFNVIKGKVDEVIYTGFQSKFFVKVNAKYLFRLIKQHVKYYLDEAPISWKDEVFIWWNCDDSYLVEVSAS
ncbi:MAG: ABC transporter ATP-binding protein [bacterium]|nr:ABC transporter ATP-binding protein [bacterium]